MKKKIVLLWIFIIILSINFVESKKNSLQQVLEPKKIVANQGEKINFKVILKNIKGKVTNNIIPPDELWTLEKGEILDLKNKRDINYSLNIPPNAQPNIYKIESIVKAGKNISNNYITVSIPYKCTKIQTPPAISESSCSPCYWGYKKSARFSNVVFYSLYDKKNLYFAIQVHDEDISSGDKVDVYFYIQGKKYVVSFTPAGKYNGELNINWVKKISGTIDNNKDTDNNYWIVASLPFQNFGVKPEENLKFKINVINIGNKKEEKGNTKFSSWSNLINSLKNIENTDLFIDVILTI